MCLLPPSPMRQVEEILADLRKTSAVIQEEARQRAEVQQSEEFTSLQEQIDALAEQQQKLLASVPDSSEEYDADKQELIAYMQENGVRECAEFKAKGRTIRSVDTKAVLEAMQGDIDNLMLVSSVKLKDLEDFAKANPEYTRDLRSCIIEEGFKISDVVLNS